MSSPITAAYDKRYFTVQLASSLGSASTIVPLVNKIVQPRSVLDVGCGTGAWLAEWQRQGVSDIWGADGPWRDRQQMQFDASRFTPVNLEESFDLGRRFDLVECVEVAEHLAPSAAEGFVRSIAAHTDTVLFGAAIPGQGGMRHVNEQWQSYWVALFASQGLRAYDVIRPRIWDDQRVQVWCRQNILLLSREHVFGPEPVLLDVVHPQLWGARQVWSLSECLGRLPAATREALSRRLRHRG